MSATVKFPVAVPTLDMIANASDGLDRLPFETLVALRMKAAAALASIESAQLLVVNRPDRKTIGADLGETINAGGEDMLTVAEAAKLLRRSTRWIWRNKRRLPFVKEITSRSMLCSKRGVEAWLASRKVS